MQIELNPAGGGAPAAPTEANAALAPPELAEGESISARVIFSSGGAAHLKTAAGAFLRARLESGVTLEEGSEITLILTEKGAGLLRLRLAEALPSGNALGFAGPAENLPALPPALAAVLEQLQNSALKAPQKLEVFMRALSDFPALSLEDAAVRQAAALLLSEGKEITLAAPNTPLAIPKLGQMLQQLSAMLNITPDAAPQALSPPTIALRPAPAAPLFELFMPPPAATQEAAACGQAELTEAGANTQALIPAKISAAELTSPLAQAVFATGQAAYAPPSREGAEQPPTVLTALPPAARQEALEFSRRLVTELFPAGAKAPPLKELRSFVERLFTRVAGPAEKDGPALREAARELAARLELLQSVLERSSLPQKEELLQQVSRLLQQNAILREERPLCLQLPIQLAKQRQTAELYMYRREKGARRLDPRQATVLLALNTEHLGRLEAFIQIRQKDINLKLEIGRASAVAFVKEQSGTLAKLLAGAGYRLASATIQHLRKETGPKTAGQALEEFRRAAGRQVDIQI